ncbi:MAG: glycosyltransferase family 2 protein [Pseudomonadota bacterium]
MVESSYKIAIGLPVYNGERFLAETIDCVLGQSFRDFELIISDNASTDATSEICQSYAARDSRIRYVRQETNLGAVPNFNHVFEISNSEYFKWAAVDDWFSHDYLERTVKILDENPDVVWCHSRSSHIDAHGEPLEEPDSQDVSYVDRGIGTPSQRFRAVLLGKYGCLDSYGLIRSAAIEKTPLYLPYYGPEKVFIAELALQGQYEEIPDTLFLVRVLEDGSGTVETAAAQSEFAVGSGGDSYFVRLNFLIAYAKAIYRTPIGFIEKVKSYSILLRWLLQISKWPRIALRAIRRQGIGGGNVERIKKIESKQINLADGNS